ncbi:MAG: HAD family hydrolase [Candidatus Nanopelagicales bacterium]
MPARLRAVLFDQDGTLINTFGPALTAYSRVVGRELTYEDLRPHAHLGAARNLVSGLLGHEATDADDDLFHEVFGAGVARIGPYPGILELLRGLREAGLATGVVTNSDARSAQIVQDGQGFSALMDVLITSDMVPAPKPAPASLLRALADLGIAADEAAFVGDSAADMRAARAAGVKSVAAGWGQQAADITHYDLWAGHPAQVRQLLGR